MQALDFKICDWHSAPSSVGPSDLTLGSLCVEVGGPAVARRSATEVFDIAARTVRQHIYVPIYPLAKWLLLNWWRLRWEPERQSLDWQFSHSIASIGDGYVWPPITFASDGVFVQLTVAPEATADVAGIRYLRDFSIEIPGADFEAAVDELADAVSQRLRACQRPDRELELIREELAEERSDPELTRACRHQAYAGFAPGDASDEWIATAEDLMRTTGPDAVDEVMAVLPNLDGSLATARERIEEIRSSQIVLDLSWTRTPTPGPELELPWQRGARLATELRTDLHLPVPLGSSKLGELLGVAFPIGNSGSRELCGGYRNGSDDDRIRATVPSTHPHSQRFYLSRLIGCSLLTSPADQLIPVTTTSTALQKADRSFAQELLCPWEALDAFTDERGLDDEAIEDAANHFDVSELLVLSTLVNKHKVPRHRRWRS